MGKPGVWPYILICTIDMSILTLAICHALEKSPKPRARPTVIGKSCKSRSRSTVAPISKYICSKAAEALQAADAGTSEEHLDNEHIGNRQIANERLITLLATEVQTNRKELAEVEEENEKLSAEMLSLHEGVLQKRLEIEAILSLDIPKPMLDRGKVPDYIRKEFEKQERLDAQHRDLGGLTTEVAKG